jgi:SUMO ligase MMS21 Smc5/6 complex component
LPHHFNTSCRPYDFVSSVIILGVSQKFTSYRNRQVCGHSFSEEAIRQTFRGSPSVAKKCPASGCNQVFKLTDLKRDASLAKKVKNWNRRNQRAADHDDAEEIIE